MRATSEIPNDRALPALAAILAVGLAGSIPSVDFDERRVGIRLRGYTAGSRATFEVRAGQRHFAVKAYAEDPTPEAALYGALAAAGLAGESDVHVPPLMAWERDLRLLVIGWLEGPTALDLPCWRHRPDRSRFKVPMPAGTTKSAPTPALRQLARDCLRPFQQRFGALRPVRLAAAEREASASE